MNQKNIIIGILVVVIVVLSYMIFFEPRSVNKSSLEEKGSNQFIAAYDRPDSVLSGINLPITKSATCSFNRLQSAYFEFKDNKNDNAGRAPSSANEMAKIYFETSIESKPNISAFIDLDTDNPKMTANMGQAEMVKIIDNEDSVVLVEKDTLSSGVLIAYTIFKKEGVGVWTKQYKLIGVPLVYSSMGYCE
jgi:hypothetical protein